MRSLIHIVFQALKFLIHLGAAAVCFRMAVLSVERGGLWYALAALFGLLGVSFVLWATLIAWGTWYEARGGRKLMDPEEEEGIEIPLEDSERLGHFRDVWKLLEAIDKEMPKTAVIYLEGTTIAPDVQEFLSSRSVPPHSVPRRGTIFPEPARFHLPLVGDNLASLRRLAEEHAGPEICDHVLVYESETVLLDAYDAIDGEINVNRSALSTEQIQNVRGILSMTGADRG